MLMFSTILHYGMLFYIHDQLVNFGQCHGTTIVSVIRALEPQLSEMFQQMSHMCTSSRTQSASRNAFVDA